MPTLTLMRHAKSSWDNPMLADHERPLNPRGKRAASVIAGRLKSAGYRPDLIIASSAIRAKETAKGFIEHYGEAIRIEEEPRLYSAGVEDYIDVIRKIDPQIKHAMIVAHNPEIEMVVEQLAGRYYKMPTAAYVRFEIPRDWQQFALDIYPVSDYDFPKSSK